VPKVCQAIQTTTNQTQLEQNAKARKPNNQATLSTQPQEHKTPCQTLRKGLYLSGLVGFSWPTLVSGGLDLALLAL